MIRDKEMIISLAEYRQDNAVKSIARVCKVNVPAKSLQMPKRAIVGIKMWGKIDFLTHYCGWTLKRSAE